MIPFAPKEVTDRRGGANPYYPKFFLLHPAPERLYCALALLFCAHFFRDPLDIPQQTFIINSERMRLIYDN